MLKAVGIQLHDRPDLFLWTGGDQSGVLTAKNVYQALSTFHWPLDSSVHFQQLWKVDCPLKIKLFTWLLIENRVLVWPNLQTRGWEGPSRCYLCLLQCETISHLFIYCPFVRAVWQLLDPSFPFYLTWTGTCVLDCLQRWNKAYSSLASLPFHFLWQIWKCRNDALFDGKPTSTSLVANVILSKVDIHQLQPTNSTKHRHRFAYPMDREVAWFDGASQKNGSQCGAGGKITLNTHTSYRWTLNCGTGSNMKAELLGTWASLNLARRLHIVDLLLLGDSKVIVDWLNGQADLKAAALESWKERTIEISHCFRNLNVTHIYREDNSEADSLSKLALLMPPGQLRYTKWVEGHAGPTINIRL